MPRRQVVGLLCASLLGLPSWSGCGSESAPASTSATNGPDYGTNKLPPAEKVAPKKGRAPTSPGAPPLKR